MYREKESHRTHTVSHWQPTNNDCNKMLAIEVFKQKGSRNVCKEMKGRQRKLKLKNENRFSQE